MKKYYLHNGTENIGPFDLEELKTKGITKSTQVWFEGIEDWKEAGKVEELKGILVVVPPPIFKAETKKEETIVKEKTNWIWRVTKFALILVSVVVGLVALTDYNNEQNSTSSYENHIVTVAEMEANEPLSFLEAGGEYRENFLGDKLKIKGFIRNTATITTYKDVVVEVVFYSKTGSTINTENYTLYEFYRPATRKDFELKVSNYSNVSKISWRVIGAIVKE